MRVPRIADWALVVGVLSLAAAIGDGQYESAVARERHGSLLWQLQVFDAEGHLLGDRQLIGLENQELILNDSVFSNPRLGLVLLPLGLPDGGLDLELKVSVNGSEHRALKGLKVTPGEMMHLEVPGQPYRLSLRALRLGNQRTALCS